MDDRLYRSRDDRMIAGVAGGVAERLDADPSIIRIVWAVLIFLTGGLALLVYIVMAIVVPERPAGMDRRRDRRANRVRRRPDEPVPAGSWRAPDGSTVPMAHDDRAPTTPPARSGRSGARRAHRRAWSSSASAAIFLIREFIPTFDFDLWWPSLLIGLGIVLSSWPSMPSRRSS